MNMFLKEKADWIIITDCFGHFTILVCMDDDYFNKMSNEDDMDMDKNVDDIVKNEDCSKFFTTMEVILLCYYYVIYLIIDVFNA